jgi:hypothetical protein
MSRLFSIANVAASQAAVLLGADGGADRGVRWAGHYYKGRGPGSPWLAIPAVDPARHRVSEAQTAKIAGQRKCCRLRLALRLP